MKIILSVVETAVGDRIWKLDFGELFGLWRIYK